MKNDDSSKWCRQLECGRTAAQFGTICLVFLGGFAFAQVEPDAPGDAIIDDPRPASRPRPTREQMGQDAQNLRDAASDIRAREVRILAELDAVTQPDLPEDHWAREWAGEYYVGDGLGMNVRILVAPTAGMTYTWRGCLGLYDGNQGEIVGTFDVDADGRPD